MSRSFAMGLVLTAFMSTGCAFYTAPVIPGLGFLYTSTSAPIDIDHDPTQMGSKTGKSSVTTILLLVSTGDASVAAAARDGGIKTVRHADYQYTNILGIVQTFTIVVYGD